MRRGVPPKCPASEGPPPVDARAGRRLAVASTCHRGDTRAHQGMATRAEHWHHVMPPGRTRGEVDDPIERSRSAIVGRVEHRQALSRPR